MASNHEFPGPWGYAVPFRDRSCPEHTFHVKENLKKKKPHDYPHIWMILHALLNSIGGILILESTQPMTSLDRDDWFKRCKDYLQYTWNIPSLILSSIGYEILGSTITMLVPRYSRKLPYNLCFSVRNITGNQKLEDLELLQTVMKQKSEPPSYMNLDTQYNHGEEFPHDENQNREYKCWKIESFAELIDHIACTTPTHKLYRESFKFPTTLLAMANDTRGGEVIIGIKEDETDRKLKVIGIPLEDSDRPEFEDVIENLLREDHVTKEPRVWCEPGIFPEKGRHWRVTYHDVTHSTRNKKRVLIRIQIDHFPGGVFRVEPSIFDINSDGFIIKIPFSKWKQHFLNMPPTNMVETEEAEQLESRKTDSDDNESNSDHEADDEQFNELEAMHVAMIVRPQEGLSWTTDNPNWNQNLGDASKHVEDHISGDSACFDLRRPLNYTPQKNTLISKHQGLKEKIEFIEKYHNSHKGFVISGEPSFSYLSDSLEAPSNHILDLLVLVYTGLMYELHLWVVMADSTNPQDLWEYAIQCGLLLKQRLMDCPYLNISVICHSLSLSNECHTTSGHVEYVKRHLCSEYENTLDNIRRKLARFLFKKHTYLTTYLGDDALIRLTEEQTKQYQHIVKSDIAFVMGPPGSGKTVLALCVAKNFNNVVYVCKNESFKQYIKFQFGTKSSVTCRIAANGEDLTTIIKSKEVEQADCLISDDIHNLDCPKEVLREAMKYLHERKIKVYLFWDPFIQEDEEKQTTRDLHSILKEIHEKDPLVPIAQITLTENHRNCRKVVSFLIRMVEGTRITSLHSLDGDDIEAWKGKNLYAAGKENGILELFRILFAGGSKFSYEAHQMALILTGKFASDYKDFIMKVLTDNLPCEVHGADDFPRTGIQVDVDTEYCGLEVPLAIVLHPRKRKVDRTSEENQNVEDRTSEENENVDDRTSEENQNVEDRTSEENQNVEDRTSEENQNADDRTSEENQNVEDRTSGENQNVEDRTSGENQNADDRISGENQNADDRTSEENQNVEDRTSEENQNADDRISEENQNVDDRTSEENQNVEDRTSGENQNADDRTSGENQNVEDRISEENQNVEDRISEENQNADDRISEEHWMNDPRLLAFLASRGILRVIFVVEKLDYEVFQKMKLDKKVLKWRRRKWRRGRSLRGRSPLSSGGISLSALSLPSEFLSSLEWSELPGSSFSPLPLSSSDERRLSPFPSPFSPFPSPFPGFVPTREEESEEGPAVDVKRPKIN